MNMLRRMTTKACAGRHAKPLLRMMGSACRTLDISCAYVDWTPQPTPLTYHCQGLAWVWFPVKTHASDTDTIFLQKLSGFLLHNKLSNITYRANVLRQAQSLEETPQGMLTYQRHRRRMAIPQQSHTDRVNQRLALQRMFQDASLKKTG
jgi:hypothetical protein